MPSKMKNREKEMMIDKLNLKEAGQLMAPWNLVVLGALGYPPIQII